MADGVYAKALEAFAKKQIDWINDTIKILFCTSGYVANLAADQYVTDIVDGSPGTKIMARSVPLTGKSATLGVLDASDVTLPGVTGSQVTQIILYKDGGTDGTSPLIAHIDSYTGLPFTPSGSDVPVTFPNDANKIMKL